MARTEWNGDDNVPANVQPKPSSALNASERLRLTYLTGEPNNAYALRDGGMAWSGQLPKPELRSKRTSPGHYSSGHPTAWDGGAWADLDPNDFVRGGGRITVSPTAPSSPALNDVWIRPL